jgi:hypothetical protein
MEQQFNEGYGNIAVHTSIVFLLRASFLYSTLDYAAGNRLQGVDTHDVNLLGSVLKTRFRSIKLI